MPNLTWLLITINFRSVRIKYPRNFNKMLCHQCFPAWQYKNTYTKSVNWMYYCIKINHFIAHIKNVSHTIQAAAHRQLEVMLSCWLTLLLSCHPNKYKLETRACAGRKLSRVLLSRKDTLSYLFYHSTKIMLVCLTISYWCSLVADTERQ